MLSQWRELFRQLNNFVKSGVQVLRDGEQYRRESRKMVDEMRDEIAAMRKMEPGTILESTGKAKLDESLSNAVDNVLERNKRMEDTMQRVSELEARRREHEKEIERIRAGIPEELREAVDAQYELAKG
eukprot:CAMPEP_0119122602 /NCGR_PEP_ID=MMETSP1310-20130426/2813_1 /TAXON_ID=464262 /ORGANISM="Genus nov. species nov., Strain RCC2339" /LENGTH=127 /DNA_ID=CAMNT_0007112283 /DNA_START=21 /DNA_END=400 /DNA_ORIENTATION=-